MRDIGYENRRTAELFMSLVKLLPNCAGTNREKKIHTNKKHTYSKTKHNGIVNAPNDRKKGHVARRRRKKTPQTRIEGFLCESYVKRGTHTTHTR